MRFVPSEIKLTVTTFVAAAGAAVAVALNGAENVTAAAAAWPTTLIIIIEPAVGTVGTRFDTAVGATHVYNVPGFVTKLYAFAPAANVMVAAENTMLPAV